MKRQHVGSSALQSPRLAYGCMRIAGAWNPAEITSAMRENGKLALRAAYEAGYRLFDHADIYASGVCEEIHGEFLRENPTLRRETILATKCGIRWDNGQHRYDFSREHIIASAEKSLTRLGVETIDLYQLHRPDLLMNPEEIAIAFTRLHAAGKVRYFGVSNFMPSFLAALQKHVNFPLCVNQVEIHLGRLAPFTDGTLDQCIEHRVTPLSWSPLGGGFLGAGGTVRPDHPRAAVLTNLLKVLDEVAAGHGVDRTVVSLAWLLKHPSGIIPIVGSAKPENIKNAVQADTLELSREEWYRILVAARGEPLP